MAQAEISMTNVTEVIDKIMKESAWGGAVEKSIEGKLDKAGGTVTGDLVLEKGSYSAFAGAGSGYNGFVNVATLTIKAGYSNTPTIIELIRRSDENSTKIMIKFTNVSNLDPTLETFYQTLWYGQSIAYLYKSATSTWDLYIKKAESYDRISIQFSKRCYQCNTC